MATKISKRLPVYRAETQPVSEKTFRDEIDRLDAKTTSKPRAKAVTGEMFIGMIVMYSGTLATIPTGWQLCDGTNGTPNLVDKFVKGVATNATNPGTAGGAKQHKHSLVTADGATAAVDAHTTALENVAVGITTLLTGPGTHTITGNTARQQSMTGSVVDADTLPPFYEIAFIMKIS